MYANKGYANPLKSRRAAKFQCVELTDNATLRLNRSRVMTSVLATICPNPLKFKQVWFLQRGDRSLYAWKAVPPEGFIALGMMCTSSVTPPDVSCMRCIPKGWCHPTRVPPAKIWDDTGAGGGKPGSIWTINSMDMIAVVPGHDPPTDIFYDLNANRFFLDHMDVPKK